jgi:hypothetical protein
MYTDDTGGLTSICHRGAAVSQVRTRIKFITTIRARLRRRDKPSLQMLRLQVLGMLQRQRHGTFHGECRTLAGMVALSPTERIMRRSRARRSAANPFTPYPMTPYIRTQYSGTLKASGLQREHNADRHGLPFPPSPALTPRFQPRPQRAALSPAFTSGVYSYSARRNCIFSLNGRPGRTRRTRQSRSTALVATASLRRNPALVGTIRSPRGNRKDGVTKQPYTITVTRAAASSAAGAVLLLHHRGTAGTGGGISPYEVLRRLGRQQNLCLYRRHGLRDRGCVVDGVSSAPCRL